MKTLDDKITELTEKHNKELTTLEQQDDISKLLSDTFMGEPLSISEHTCYADAFVTYNAASLHDALVFAEKANPLSIFRVKDSCLSFKPEASITEKDEDRATIDVIGPWKLTADTMRQYGTTWTLTFYISLDKFTVEVRVSIDEHTMRSDGYYIQWDYKHPSQYHPEGRIESCNAVYPRDHFTKQDRYWAAEGQPNNYALY